MSVIDMPPEILNAETKALFKEFDNSNDMYSDLYPNDIDPENDNYASNYFVAHYYELHDQKGDATNLTGSASTYDEAIGPQRN